jgi:hypothetical protein
MIGEKENMRRFRTHHPGRARQRHARSIILPSGKKMPKYIQIHVRAAEVGRMQSLSLSPSLSPVVLGRQVGD